MDKEKLEKWDRIYPKRIENFRVSADRLSKLGNKYYFECTPDQKKELLDEVDKITKMIKNKF